MSNRKFCRKVEKLSVDTMLGVMRMVTGFIFKHPEIYTEEQVERARELLREAEEKAARGSSNEPSAEEPSEPAERDEP